MNYTCSGCGRKREDADRCWLALRLSADRRAIEIRTFENSGPDDVYFCDTVCAFRRIEEMLGPQGTLAASAESKP